ESGIRPRAPHARKNGLKQGKRLRLGRSYPYLSSERTVIYVFIPACAPGKRDFIGSPSSAISGSNDGGNHETLSMGIRSCPSRSDFFNCVGVNPVIFLNCPERCATLLYPNRSAISLNVYSS